jgi:two-component system sensor histidine kinase MprB
VTLRARIAAVAGLAVALAVIAVAIALYVAVRADLRRQVDQSLNQRAQGFGAIPPGGPPPGGGLSEGQLFGGGAAPPGQSGFPKAVQPARFGGASGYVQFIQPHGAVVVPSGQGSSPEISPDTADRTIAARGVGRALSDRTVKGVRLRVLTIGSGARGAVLIALPLSDLDKELSRILLILVVVGVSGIALAAVLGALVARATLAPITRFTRRTEALTEHLNMAERLEVTGRDELARLAVSFNATLEELERSVEAQRHLIADASHELRTPLASLRANIQTLRQAERLTVEDRASLREDIVAELDELTLLVGDVVELARGTGREHAVDDVRLDEIVKAAIERTRRRGDLRFQAELEPTVIVAEPDRVSRAVSNLLDNARKWSPVGGLVEVTLSEGVLSVRDHGPGFEEQDLANVFERFFRASEARKLPGSGLGLAIVRQAAEAHRGYAKAENAPGGGARLTVNFGPASNLSQGVGRGTLRT